MTLPEQGDMTERGLCIVQCCAELCKTVSLIWWLLLRCTETKLALPRRTNSGCCMQNKAVKFAY